MLSRPERKSLEEKLYQDDPSMQTLSSYKDANTRRTDEDKEEDLQTSQDVTSELLTKALMDLPLRWKDNRLTVEKNVRTTITCGIPPTANNGRWSATVNGSSVVRGPMGCASGSMNVAYKLSKASQIHGGLQVGDQSNLHIGGTIKSGQTSSIGVNIYSKPKSSVGASLSAHHKFNPCRVDGRVTLGSIPNWSVSVSSLAIHKVQIGMGWNRSQPLFHASVYPKISSHRRGSLSVRWRPTGGCNIGAVLNQSLASKVTSLGTGIQLSKKRLEWIFTWNRGDVTIRIPIIISQYANVWMDCLQVAYLSLISGLIQEIVADLWSLNVSPEESKELQIEHQRMKQDKGRKDAEQQKKLMLKQAKSRVKAEEEKDGLVIRQAVYQAQGGDSWDVTAQLQFWTESSSLELPASSKQNLLGFYNVANGISETEADDKWWTGLWKQPKSASDGPKPTLTVQYEYAGRPYKITILDDEPLKLPTSKALPVK